MKKCKHCNGTGMIFKKGQVFTGKETFGFPEMKRGNYQTTCTKCFGKGVK